MPTVKKWWVLAGAGLAVAMGSIDSMAVSIALPAIGRDVDASFADLQWTLNAYLLALAVLVGPAGRLGDLAGRRRMFVAGLATFATASALCGAAQADWWIIAARAVQGAGAAAMFALALALVRDAFPAAELGRALGIFGALGSLGLAVGPVLGGVLTQHVSWRAIFFVNVPVAALSIAIVLAAAREARDPAAERRLDLAGPVLLTGGLGALMLGVIQADAWGWGSPAVLVLLAGGLAALAALVAVERRAPAPLLDLRVLRARAFVGAAAVLVASMFVVFSWLFVFTLFFQRVRGDDPVEAGLSFLPYALAFLICGPPAGRLVEVAGARALVTAGMALLTLAAALLTGVDAGTGYVAFAVPAALIGVASAMVVGPVISAGLTSVPAEKAGVASGMLTASQFVGGSVGVATIGAVVLAFDGVGAGVEEAMLANAAVAAAGALVALVTLRAPAPHTAPA